jgi:hypothetical protein
MKRVVLGVGAGELRRAVRVDSTEHMVIGEKVAVAEFFDRPPNPANRGRVTTELCLRVDNADLNKAESARDAGVRGVWRTRVRPRPFERWSCGYADEASAQSSSDSSPAACRTPNTGPSG